MLNRAMIVVTAAILLAILLPRFQSKEAGDPHEPAVAAVKRSEPVPMPVRQNVLKPAVPSSDVTADSRYSPDLLPNAKGEKLRTALLADCIAFRQVWGKRYDFTDAYRQDGFVFRKRLLYESFLLNMCPVDVREIDKLIRLSGCGDDWSAQRMQKQILAYLVRNSKNPVAEQHTQEMIGKHGFGWLGEPGDQSLDIFRFYFDLRPGQTLGDTVVGLVPPGFEIGGIPLQPRPRTRSSGNRLGITRDDVRRAVHDVESQVPEAIRQVRSEMLRQGLSPAEVEEQMRELEVETRRQIRGMEDDVWREVEQNR